jgi:hypothetical protein
VLRRPFEFTLAALVGVMDYGGGTTLANGHIECRED